eukprot:1144000-Pelagomonas_calceolata.AAC.3
MALQAFDLPTAFPLSAVTHPGDAAEDEASTRLTEEREGSLLSCASLPGPAASCRTPLDCFPGWLSLPCHLCPGFAEAACLKAAGICVCYLAQLPSAAAAADASTVC